MGARIALVAGEASGDILGAALIRALRARLPGASFYGVAGPRMQAAGCEAVESIEALSIMGFGEVIRQLPRLLRLRRGLVERFAADRPEVYIGIDAPDFNLGIERRLRERGLRTVHLVSPSVWAWRQGRIHGIKRAVDLMLCLFPFEEDIYRRHGVPVETIGHPLADELDATVTPAAARRALGLPEAGRVVAVLPGSRHGIVGYLSDSFAGAAAWLAQRHPDLRFVVPLARPDLRARFERAIAAHAPGARWHLLDGQSREAMQAADVVLLASGTATLEGLLLGRPMVAAYRSSWFTAFLLRQAGMLKVSHVTLPNLLCARPVVPELMQEAATPDQLGRAVEQLLDDPARRAAQLEQFAAVRSQLRRDAGRRAADAIARMLAAWPVHHA